jgi:phosphoribosyl-ATP pyrophosphohydrolase/phosphoribosyl-AMP cyclohydrolase/histidinol dehydrogenase
MTLLERKNAQDVVAMRRDPVEAEACSIAKTIVDDVRARGEVALREYAERFGDIEAGGVLFFGSDALKVACDAISKVDCELLERTAARIGAFALAQRESICAFEIPIPGGMAGQQVSPVARAGCYAPGGRYPLPSSVLMTAVTARAAGVPVVWVASPRPTALTFAAAHVAGADGVLAAGGAQAIAALAFGAGPVPACDVVVGPGNKYVTAAKKIVSGNVGIDMLAGPSELVVVADGRADPVLVAADLLAQAEHDVDAVPVLVALDASVATKVEQEIARQLTTLPTAKTASAALGNGFSVVVRDIEEAARVCDMIAPEHLELMVAEAQRDASRFNNYGALFIGEHAAEVLGDYGAGPNHTLPTGGSARYTGGLSVMHFLRVRTWMRIDESAEAMSLVDDAKRLGEIEGLAGHARAANLRR